MVDTKPEVQAEEADMKERIEGFNKEVIVLLAKFELGLAALPRIANDGRLFAEPIVVSVRGKDAAPEAPANDAGLAKVE